MKEVESKPDRGMSVVTVRIKDQYDKSTLPQVWCELRRKVSDAQRSLPPGGGFSVVVDDLLVFMGLRSGLLIGFMLVLTIADSFPFLDSVNVALERISLGMLVDNAIVVVDGMLVRVDGSHDHRRARCGDRSDDGDRTRSLCGDL